jgi:alpha-beta hydrolase superfamily lysophospholipase
MGDTAAATETREQAVAGNWARFAADSHAEIALMHAGNDDAAHRAKVREAQERALARGSDFV